MGKTFSRLNVKTFGLDIQSLVPVLRYKRMCQDLQAENYQVKTYNQDLKTQNEKLQISLDSFEKDNMQQSLKIQELKLQNQHLNTKCESYESKKMMNDELLELRIQMTKMIEKQTSRVMSPKDIGDEGESFVFNCLQEAFPNNTGIIRNGGLKNSGDIMFRVENSDKVLMFEVKNMSKLVPGKDIQKFFDDLENSQYHGGVLLALNCPVNIHVPQLVPQLHKGKPYVYVDRLKDSRDAVCLMQMLVSMMTFMMNFASDLEHNNPQLQLNYYSRQTEELKKLFERLLKSNSNQCKILDAIKLKLLESKSSLAGKLSLMRENIIDKN